MLESLLVMEPTLSHREKIVLHGPTCIAAPDMAIRLNDIKSGRTKPLDEIIDSP